MESFVLSVVAAILIYCLLSAKLARFAITMPMVFLALGVVVGFQGLSLSPGSATMFHDLAEVTLALVLFADATRLKRSELSRFGKRTVRMLLLGLPIAIMLGTAVNYLLLPGWPLWELCLLAALLAPTDAALGQAVQSNERIPYSLRNAMNAESGLNDGLALPFVIFFAGLSIGETSFGPGEWALVKLVAAQIGLGALAGLAGGVVIALAANLAAKTASMDESFKSVAMLACVAVIYFVAHHIGGNAFVAVFISGAAFANVSTGSVHHVREFIEGDGQFLAILSFFFIGALFVPEALAFASPVYLLLVALSLVLVRPLAIWLSLAGTGTSANEKLFLGWFGPRGLATALFAVFVVLDFKGLSRAEEILVICIMAVFVSAFVHGISAKWACELFKLAKPDVHGGAAAPRRQEAGR